MNKIDNGYDLGRDQYRDQIIDLCSSSIEDRETTEYKERARDYACELSEHYYQLSHDILTTVIESYH